MKYATVRHVTLLTKIICMAVLVQTSTASAFSFKTFVYTKYSALKNLSFLRKNRGVEFQELSEQQKISDQRALQQEVSQDMQQPEAVKEAEEKNDSAQEESPAEEARPSITVWVHGTTKNSLLGLLKKEGSRGLLLVNTVERAVKSKRVASALIRKDEQKFSADSFYLFRWSGKLSYKEREREAKNLYRALEKKVQHYRELYGVSPYIRIMAHSHGGNVVLNLAKAKEADTDFVIDELILLACPVQDTTKYMIGNPLFKRVYALYSSSDFVQVAAPQGFGFSGRHFLKYPNVMQAEVRVDGKSIGHFDFVKPEFMTHLPEILEHLEQHDGVGTVVQVNQGAVHVV